MTTRRSQDIANEMELSSELEMLREENLRLRKVNQETFAYIRRKVDDLLAVIGTSTLQPEELDDFSLIEFDPIGIVSDAFRHVLENTHETNRKLQFAHSEIQTIFDTVGAAVLVLNPQGAVVSYNQKTKDILLGRDVDITGKNCRQHVCGNRGTDERCIFQAVSREGREQHFHDWSHNGRSFDVIGRPMFDEAGELSHVVISYSDVSARRDAEASMLQALRETQEVNAKLHGMLRSVADSVLVTDAHNRIVLMNRRAEELFSLNISDKRVQYGIDLLQHEELVGFLKTASGQSQDLLVKDFAFQDHAGENRIYQARMTVITSPKTGFNGCITILHDVTEQREMERMKSEFVSTAAHELRTPLATILGYADLLLMKEDATPKERKDYLELIQNRAERLGDIVSDLLDISRIESGQGLQLEPKPCHLDLLCKEVLQSFEPQTQQHEFVFDVASPLLIYADRFAVLQILENVISNAIKYSPDGGVINISAERNAGVCILSIADHGIGMTVAQQEKIYEKFYRVDATNTAISGTGLGMTIVKHLVEAQGGQVKLESVPGEGTTVTIQFPVPAE